MMITQIKNFFNKFIISTKYRQKGFWLYILSKLDSSNLEHIQPSTFSGIMLGILILSIVAFISLLSLIYIISSRYLLNKYNVTDKFNNYPIIVRLIKRSEKISVFWIWLDLFFITTSLLIIIITGLFILGIQLDIF